MSKTYERVALVTGAASGIGKCTAVSFAKEGVAVVVADVQDQLGEALVKEIKASGGAAAYVHLDVSDESQWKQAIKFTIDTFGRLLHLVHNAAVSGPTQTIEETRREDFEKTFAIGGTSIILGSKHASEHLQKHPGKATVVNVASILGLVASDPPLWFGYSATKGACTLISKNLAVAWAKKGIRSNSVHPGYIRTPIIEIMGQEKIDEIEKRHPIGRMGQPQEVADLILYLSSDKSTFITGAAISVDGGFTAV